MTKTKQNKGGRPPKKETEKLTSAFKGYFTSLEEQRINAFFKALGYDTIKKNDIVRYAILSSIENTPIPSNPEIRRNTHLELNKIGVNLNQIAKKLNSLDTVYQKDLDSINAVRLRLTKSLDAL